MTFEIVSLFPELFDSWLRTSLLGKAVAAEIITVHRTNPRDFTHDKHRTVDDSPYGGGPGMIMRPEPVVDAVEHVVKTRGAAHRILLSPQGHLFTQARARALTEHPRIVLLCGRYEGIDERVSELCVDEVLSIGDYVLAGGELAAAVVIESVARLLPGVLGCSDSVVDESHEAGRLEYPQWTRPPNYRGLSVPGVLTSGDHAAVADWRMMQALRRTEARRPDLLERFPPTDREGRLEQKAQSQGAEGQPPATGIAAPDAGRKGGK